jgi:hypothetical protein
MPLFFANPSIFTYGLIGMTTIILAALTVFDSTEENGDPDKSYVSQLLQNEPPSQEAQQEAQQEQQQETSIVSSLYGGDNESAQSGGRKKTRRNLKRAYRKTHHKK